MRQLSEELSVTDIDSTEDEVRTLSCLIILYGSTLSCDCHGHFFTTDLFLFFIITSHQEEKQWSAIQELRNMKLKLIEEEKVRKEQLELSDNDDSDDEKQANSFLFTMRQRRAHYKRKLNSLDKLIRDLKKERQDIDAFRTKCTIDMRAKEKLLRSYKLGTCLCTVCCIFVSIVNTQSYCLVLAVVYV